MHRRFKSSAGWLGTVGMLLALSGVGAAYNRVGQVTVAAQATVGSGGGGGSSGLLTFNVPELLPQLAFYGKDVVIPVEIRTPANPPGAPPATFASLQPDPGLVTVSMVYQILDPGLNPLGGGTVPVAMRADNPPGTSFGNGLIPALDMLLVRQGGFLDYYFQIQRGAQAPVLVRAGTGQPFRLQFTTLLNYPVDPAGSVIVIPDTNLVDGKTTLSFPPNAVPNSGALSAHLLNPASVPIGPNGLSPITVYEFDLQGTRLVSEVQMTLTYPAHLDGSLIGSNGQPDLLAAYRLDGSNWVALGPRKFDSTRHTLTLTLPHFSTYALFLSGAVGAADLRPRQRILTPNGDGINDTIDFSGIGAAESVQLFDLRGRRVRTLRSPNLVWDGRDDNQRIVESGVYLYQYSSQGDRVSGVIMVAK